MSMRGLNMEAVYVAPSRLNGHGVFAARGFQAGERVFVLSGDEFTKAQILTRGEEHAANAYQIDDDLYIYPLDPEGRFMNHGCEPNAGLRDDREMIALRYIPAGDEILFDYSTTMSEKHWTMTCTCGAPGCRGMVGDFHELPAVLQQRYLRLGIVQRFIVRQILERAAAAIQAREGDAKRWGLVAAEAIALMGVREPLRRMAG